MWCKLNLSMFLFNVGLLILIKTDFLIFLAKPRRYVDDTFVIQKEINKQDFLQHLNSIDPVI